MKIRELKTIIDLLDDDVEITIHRTPPDPKPIPIGFQVPAEQESLLTSIKNEEKEIII